MSFLGTFVRGSLPRMNMAAQIIEIAPGLDIEPLTDVALKASDVKAGILVVERQFGYLEFHSHSTDAVNAATQSILDQLKSDGDISVADVEILASKIISNVDHEHAFLINRNKSGSMLLPGESLFV